MVAWAIKDFGGMVPRRDPRILPDNMAEQAVNCDIDSGALTGLPIPQLVIDLSSISGTARAYRFPLPGNPDVWLPLPDKFSSVVRSPLANDTSHRIYWTNPPDSSNPGAFFITYAMLAAGGAGANAPFNLGTVQPGQEPAGGIFPTGAPTVTSSGGSVEPLIARSYVWTYVDAFGQESAPSEPSSVISGHSDGTWDISGMPTTAPGNPSGFNFPSITGVNLYRTSTGTQTGAAFYQVEQFVYGVNSPPTTFTDTLPDTSAVNNLQLVSASWANPPAGIDGLIAMSGGMLMAFQGNNVIFSEVDRPHTWPAAYQQSMQYQIVGLAVWQQTLMVLTTGYPSSGSGNSPSNFVFSQIRVPEPCVSRGSIVTDLMSVYYSSQNGLVALNYYGMQNQTLSNFTKNSWLNDYAGATLMACRHRASFLAARLDGSNTGFIIDYAEQRMGVMNVNVMEGVTAIWNDEYQGTTYMCAAGKVYEWDSPAAGPLTYRWRSRQFYGPAPISLGAAQIALDAQVLDPTPSPNAQTLTNGDTSTALPASINAMFNVYVGGNTTPVYTQYLTEKREIFRLPSGFKAFDWQFEIVARVPVHSIEVGTTMRELKGV